MTVELTRDVDGLDGAECSLVSGRVGAWDVMVGGGPDGFVVTATSADGTRIANALSALVPRDSAVEDRDEVHGDDDDDDDETVDLTVGGQAVDYPRRYVLSRAEVSVAIMDLDAQRLSSDRWELVE